MKRNLQKKLSLLLAFLSISIVLTISIILEPCVKIKNYDTLDINILDNIKNTLVIYDDNENQINTSQYTPLKNVPTNTINAFLCAEDKRFFEHEGIDYARIIAATIKDIKDGAFVQGASTITQQLVKNSHLNNDKNIRRKIQEIRLSKEIERKYTKNEILEMYLNILYFGNGTYGIGNAAHNFFGKDITNVSLKESAALSAIINNPTLYNPYSNAENLSKRSNLILKLMLKNKRISNKEYAVANKEELNVKQQNFYDKYRYFVINEACNILGCNEDYLYKNNVKIYSYCCSDLQRKLSNYLKQYTTDNAQIIIIDNKTSKIISHEAQYPGNPALISRSPGSTIKPIICYAPAIEKGIALPITPILDEKTNFNGYEPLNYKNKYYGWVSCKYALSHSLNIPAIKLLDSVGIDYAKTFANSLGIKTQNNEDLALALGGMTNGTTLKSLASAYTSFANYGIMHNNSYIKSICVNGKSVYLHQQTQKRVMDAETAYLINEMLNDCAKNGTAKIINSSPMVWCAKTGTVGNKEKNSDAYCIAYSKDYTVGVHIMDTQTTGGNIPTKLVKKLITSDITCNKPFDMPSSIRKLAINATEYYNNHRIIAAQKNLPQKDTITASFTLNCLPEQSDKRSEYEKHSDFFDTNNFTIVDSFFD